MRIVIILCLCPAPRKVLGPETLAARRGSSACSFDCNTNRCHLGIPGTQQSLAPRNPWHPETSGSTPPPNFACNSPTPLSNFESTSLRFCGFLAIDDLSDHRITCEIGESSGSISALHQVLRRSHNSYSPSPTSPSPCPSQTQVAQTPHPHDLRRTSIPPVRTSPVD